MAEAAYRHGKPQMVDYTPTTAIAAGQVVPIGEGCLIAHSDLQSGRLEAAAAAGGVYECAKATGSSTAIGDRVSVYWNDTTNVITTTASGNAYLGVTVGASTDDDATQHVQHEAPSA